MTLFPLPEWGSFDIRVVIVVVHLQHTPLKRAEKIEHMRFYSLSSRDNKEKI